MKDLLDDLTTWTRPIRCYWNITIPPALLESLRTLSTQSTESCRVWEEILRVYMLSTAKSVQEVGIELDLAGVASLWLEQQESTSLT